MISSGESTVASGTVGCIWGGDRQPKSSCAQVSKSWAHPLLHAHSRHAPALDRRPHSLRQELATHEISGSMHSVQPTMLSLLRKHDAKLHIPDRQAGFSATQRLINVRSSSEW